MNDLDRGPGSGLALAWADGERDDATPDHIGPQAAGASPAIPGPERPRRRRQPVCRGKLGRHLASPRRARQPWACARAEGIAREAQRLARGAR